MPDEPETAKFVREADETGPQKHRAEIAVAIKFGDQDELSAEDRAKIQQQVKEVLEAALRDGQLIPPYARLPKPRIVNVQPLPYRCEHCHEVVSPFVMM